MTPARLESLRADFEAACARLPTWQQPPLDRVDSGEYRLLVARERWLAWQMAWAHYCDGEASGPGDEA